MAKLKAPIAYINQNIVLRPKIILLQMNYKKVYIFESLWRGVGEFQFGPSSSLRALVAEIESACLVRLFAFRWSHLCQTVK